MILNRCACHGDTDSSTKLLNSLGSPSARVLYGLGFIKHNKAPLYLTEQGKVANNGVVRRDRNIKIPNVIGKPGPVISSMQEDFEFWHEASELAAPVL